MIRHLGKLYILILMMAGSTALADTYLRQPSIDALHYDISIEVTDASDSIKGITKLLIQVRNEAASGMWLDFEDMAIEKLLVGGAERPFTYQDGRLVFEFDRVYLPRENVPIEVRYNGTPRTGIVFGKNRYGKRVVFADNWPNKAHHWFPSIDHPSDKATVSFAVTAPAMYDVVANGSQGTIVPLPNGRKLTRWHENKTIPTYCMAFGVAEFFIARATDATVPLAWYVFPQDSKLATAKFHRTGQMLAYFENRIGPYPYEKLAQVESLIRFSAMENASAIFYSESLFLEKSASDEPVGHEIAHQWFGNSVTESDWDHLWLSEGFATYFDALFNEHVEGPEALQKIMARGADRIRTYKSALFETVVNPAQTDPFKKLTPLNYEKGAWILHMLRGMLGDEAFFKGIRRFYTMYEGGNASSEDFKNVMEEIGGIDLNSFFRQWLYRPGWPEYRLKWTWSESTGEMEITISQVQAAGLFDMPVEVVVSTRNRREVHRLRIRDVTQTFRMPLEAKPYGVELDPGNWILRGK